MRKGFIGSLVAEIRKFNPGMSVKNARLIAGWVLVKKRRRKIKGGLYEY